MKKIYLMMLLLLLPTSAFSGPELKGSFEELRKYLLDERSIIIISGSGEEKAKADTTIVSLMVKTKEDKFQTALDKNIKIRKEVKSRLIAGGVQEDKVEIAKYSSTPTYSWLGDKPSGYGISNEIMVTIEKEAHLVLIAEIVDTIKEVYFLKTDLKHTRKQEYRTKALEKSLEEVNARKQLYEKSLGITLSPVRVIEQTLNEGIPMSLNQEMRKSYAGGSASSGMLSDAGEGSPGFGEIVYRAQTQVEFMVNQKRQ